MATVLTLLPRYDYDPTEAAVPWAALVAAGHRVIFSTPEGHPAWADRILTGGGFGWLSPLLNARPDALADYAQMTQDADFLHPFPHAAWPEHPHDALLIPGGHAPGVKTLLESRPAQDCAVDAFGRDLPVAAICHGPVLLARSVDPGTGRSVLHGRKGTALTRLLEYSGYFLTFPLLGRLFRTYPELVADEVGAAMGDPGNFQSGPLPLTRDSAENLEPGFVVRDGNLISARWPGDAHRFAAELLAALALAGCHAPDPVAVDAEVFPSVYTAQTDLEPYEEVRFETQTWTPEEDPETLALYVRKALEHRKGAPVESLDHFEAMRAQIPPLADGLRVSFVGDIMWLGDNWEHAADGVAELLDGDLRVGNLETPTDPDTSTEQGALGVYAFNAPPEYLDGLPFDLLQLNNNHSLDAGDPGLEATVREVEARGIASTGVDAHARLGEVAFLSYTWGLNDFDAVSAHELFIVPFGHLDEQIDLSGIAADIADARAEGAASVVVMLHWGYEYEYYPDPHFLQLAREIIAAGADLIVGEGPHVVQPPEFCQVNDPDVAPGIGRCSVVTEDGAPRTAAVLYSLGNFATDMSTTPCKVGIVATVSLDPDVTGLGWRAVATTAGHVLVPLSDALDDAALAEEAARLDAHLGTGWRREDGDEAQAQ